tara:strand:- start:849 stop:1199 length:351 start_codon:yes stop_codon:yes gene_type:complete
MRIKYALVMLVAGIIEFFSKLIGTFDPDKIQVSKKHLVVMFGPSEEEKVFDLKIMIPREWVRQDPDYVIRTATLLGWVLNTPDHYWTSTALGVDVVEEATKRIGNLENPYNDKNDE